MSREGEGHVATPFQERLAPLSLLLRRPTTWRRLHRKSSESCAVSECAMNASTIIHITGHLHNGIILLLHLNLVIPAKFK